MASIVTMMYHYNDSQQKLFLSCSMYIFYSTDLNILNFPEKEEQTMNIYLFNPTGSIFILHTSECFLIKCLLTEGSNQVFHLFRAHNV